MAHYISTREQRSREIGCRKLDIPFYDISLMQSLMLLITFKLELRDILFTCQLFISFKIITLLINLKNEGLIATIFFIL